MAVASSTGTDVYKRQILGRYPKSSSNVNNGKKIAIGGSITDITHVSVVSVSYTHLDVYKRQLIEGNEYPGHVFYVFAEHHPDKKGCRHVFESVMA